MQKIPEPQTEKTAVSFFNRELSWLKFNQRVLEEAQNEQNPLLERLKFLAIFSSNLDEFMMIRYAGLKEQVDAGIDKLSFDGMTPQEQVTAISEALHKIILEHRKLLSKTVLPELERAGIALIPIDKLSNPEHKAVEAFFHSELFPVLTPLAVDVSHPFPRLPNLSFTFLLEVIDEAHSEANLALVQVPNVLPRFFPLPGKSHRFVVIEDILEHYVGELFPGYSVTRAHPFRVTRNADFEIAEDEADDLLQAIEDEVRQRRWGDPVRLELSSSMPKKWKRYLTKTLDLSNEDVYEIPNHLNVSAFMELTSLDIPELKYPPFVSRLPSEYRNEKSIFDAISKEDILIHHPFHAFDAVLDLIDEAASDPNVLAIKQTLYRVGRQSPIVAALMKAAGNGKLVTALVELKARFDEENNIVWARELERAGVHVVYGFPELKTHCKTLLIVRREGNEIKRYVHLGTGNYNRSTASMYTDLGLLTCNPEIAADASELFNYLTGFSKQKSWRKLWIAPETLKTETINAINKERDIAASGQDAHIIAKMNSLVDPDVIRALYEASQAGVHIQLLIRGICCLKPGVKGLSETIQVRSIIGRFLEHSRIFYFKHAGLDSLYIGSADWMQRNLTRRVEALLPIEDPKLKDKIMAILELYLRDNEKARVLSSDGVYAKPKRQPGQHKLNAQERLLELSARRLAEMM